MNSDLEEHLIVQVEGGRWLLFHTQKDLMIMRTTPATNFAYGSPS